MLPWRRIIIDKKNYAIDAPLAADLRGEANHKVQAFGFSRACEVDKVELGCGSAAGSHLPADKFTPLISPLYR